MTEALRVRCLRVAVLAISVAWLCKTPFWTVAVPNYVAWPLHDFFFPAALQRVEVVIAVAVVAVSASVWAVCFATVTRLVLALGAQLLGSLVLLLHQLTYNDATFVTSSWCALYALWLAHASARESSSLAARATPLAYLVVALLFFGGLLGKLTPGYWDGSVMYGLYFQSSPHWSFALARSTFAAETLPEVARWYGRFVLLMELLLALLPLWPLRWGLRFATLAMIGLVVFSNFYLLSVVAPLIAMCQIPPMLAASSAPSARLRSRSQPVRA